MIDTHFLQRLKHQCTRDLYWLLASEYPLNPNHAVFQLFPESILKDMVIRHTDFIVELDQSPQEFIEYLNTKPTRRLGIYAERLMAYFFDKSPLIELVTHSSQIIREGDTLGEIDFIIEWKGELYHIELAVKYYLGTADLNQMENWIGPSGNDTLALKLDKALSKQLPLAREPEVSLMVGGRNITSYLFLKGKFFCNAPFEDHPSWLNPSSKKGRYYRMAQAEQVMNSSSNVHLIRPNWLSDISISSDLNHRELKYDELENEIIKNGGVHLIQKEHPLETSFIVRDSWPN
jgi:hypothetical protein